MGGDNVGSRRHTEEINYRMMCFMSHCADYYWGFIKGKKVEKEVVWLLAGRIGNSGSNVIGEW